MRIFLEHLDNPVLRFEVLEFDKSTGMGKLRGRHGTEWTRDISKPMLKKCRYRLVTVEGDDDAKQPELQA